MRKEQRVIESEIYAVEELDSTYRRLYEAAFEAAGRAYAPYSGFQVGAALLLANGEIVTGSNQENIAYPSGLCCRERWSEAAGCFTLWRLPAGDGRDGNAFRCSDTDPFVWSRVRDVVLWDQFSVTLLL